MLSNLWIALGVRFGALSTGLASAGRLVSTFAINSRLQLAKVNAAFNTLGKLKGVAPLAIGLAAIAAALLLSIGPAIAFEKAMAGVAKTVEATDAELGVIREGILAMSREMPIAAVEIAGVAEAAGQIGIATPDILEFTRVMLQLGTATDLTAKQAAISFARLKNIMQIPIEQIPILAAALVELGNNSAATESEILHLSLRVAGAGKQFGLTGVEVLAISAAMKSLGLEAESAGSSMSRVIQDIVRAIDAGGGKLDLFARTAGLTTEAFVKMAENDPSAVLLAFFEGLQAIDAAGGSVLGTLGALDLDSIRLLRSISALVVGGDTLADSLGLVSDEAQFGSALLDEYGRFADTTSAKLKRLGSIIKTLAIDIGTPVLGAVAGLADGVGDAIASLTETFGPATEAFKALVASIVEGFDQILGVFSGAGGGGVFQTFFELLNDAMLLVLDTMNLLPPSVNALLVVLVALKAVGLLGVLTGWVTNFLLVDFAAKRATVSLVGVKTAAQSLIATLGPIALVFAAFTIYSRHVRGLKDEASDLATVLDRDLAAALDNAEFTKFSTMLEEAKAKMADLRAEIDDFDSGVLFGTELEENITSAIFGFLGFEYGVGQARAELEAFFKVTEKDLILDAGLKDLADAMNITYAEAAILAEKLGLVNDIVEGGNPGLNRALGAMEEYRDSFIGVSEATGVGIGAIVEFGLTLDEFSVGLGLSAAQVEFWAERVDLATDDLTDPTKFNDNKVAIEGLIAVYDALGSQVGITADQYRSQVEAIDAVINANERLQAALSKVDDRRAAAVAQQEALNAANVAYGETLVNFESGEATFTELATAAGVLIKAYTASGVGIQQATAFQNAMILVLQAAGRELDLTTGEVNFLIASLAVLGDSDIIDITVLGRETIQAALDQHKDLVEQLKDPVIATIAADAGISEAAFRQALADGEAWALALFAAQLAAEDSDFRATLDAALADAALFAGLDPTALLKADATQAYAEADAATLATQTYADLENEALLTADATAAFLVADLATLANTTYAELEYEAVLTAANEEAIASADFATLAGIAFATHEYLAKLEADEQEALDSADFATISANTFAAGDYEAVLEADISDVLIKAAAAQAAIDSVSGKTVFIDVITRTSSVLVEPFGGGSGLPVSQTFDGGIVPAPPVRAFHSGGFHESHTAKITKQSATTRQWDEWETGGEAYIPMAKWKRRRSMAIVSEVVNQFGGQIVPMADGGVLNARSLTAGARFVATPLGGGGGLNIEKGAVNVYVDASGLSATDAEAVAARAVERGLTDFARGYGRAGRTRVAS